MSNLTKKALKNGLIELLETKDLNKITIQELVDYCDIVRNTFYYHYTDIYALLEDVMADYVETLKESITVLSEDNLFDQTIDFILSRRKLITHIYDCVDRKLLEHYLGTMLESVLMHYVNVKLRDNYPQEKLEFVESFIKYAIVGIIMSWFDQGFNTDLIDDYSVKLHKYLNEEVIIHFLDK